MLIEGTRRLELIINAHRNHIDQPSIADLLARIETVARPAVGASIQASQASPAADNTRRWVCTFSPTKDLLASGIGVDAIRKRLGEVGSIVDAAPTVQADGTISFQFTVSAAGDLDVSDALRGIPVSVELTVPEDGRIDVDGEMPAVESAAPAAAAPSHVVRVDLTRLDDLMRNVGDLVISRARLTETLARVERHVPPVEWRAVQENAVAIDRQLRTLREGIMRVRLVPVGEIFRRMPFVVRDLARETGKRVRLELRGAVDRDRQVPDRADDGSGASSRAQRGQPRHRTARDARRGRQAARRHDHARAPRRPATWS